MTEGVPTVTGPADDMLSERERTDYHEFKQSFIKWLEAMGKNPNKVEGYATATMKQTSTRVDTFYQWLWSDDGYTTTATEDDADAYVRHLVMDEDYSKNYLSNEQKSIKRLFKWLNYERGGNFDWDPDLTFSSPSDNPRDFLTKEERKKIREAALQYGSIPAYNGLSIEERDEWKAYLAQRFDKPKSAIGKSDWSQANGWKIPSLVWTSLDTGLRPIEVERSSINWVDIDNRVLRIPKEESSKNEDNWIVSITDRTASAVERWLNERELYDKYTDTDDLWLTREGNPYKSNSLARIIKRLCDIAEMSIDGRTMSWYTIRHSVGTYMTREEDLAAAQAQLRHKSVITTTKYDQVPVEDRRDALNKMG
jgi:site-specific recombinase XerD